MNVVLSLVLGLLACLPWEVTCVVSPIPYNSVKSDYEKLVEAYQSSSVGLQPIIPKGSLSSPITVSLGMNIYAIIDFDAVNGKITLIGSLTMQWVDGIRTVAGTSFTGAKETIMVDYDQIWSPNLVLMNDAESIQRIGDIAFKVRYNISSGLCRWTPRLIINAACTPDMTYYPFDEQVCPLVITPWFQDETKVKLATLSDEWNTDDLDSSGIWSVASTKSISYTSEGSSFVDFTITIKRKPLFLSIVIVLPVLLLSLLTGFLFLLPSGSGERTGFGITCFLSFVVILQVLMQFMPESSVPMSILCYYIITMLMFSAGLSIVNMLILRMYLSPSSGGIPAWLILLVKVARCIPCRLCYRRCKCRKKLKACCRRCCDDYIFPACRYCRKTICICWEKYGRCQCICHRHKERIRFDAIKNPKFSFAAFPMLWQNKQDGEEMIRKAEPAIRSGLRSRLSSKSLKVLPYPTQDEVKDFHSDSGRPSTGSFNEDGSDISNKSHSNGPAADKVERKQSAKSAALSNSTSENIQFKLGGSANGSNQSMSETAIVHNESGEKTMKIETIPPAIDVDSSEETVTAVPPNRPATAGSKKTDLTKGHAEGQITGASVVTDASPTADALDNTGDQVKPVPPCNDENDEMADNVVTDEEEEDNGILDEVENTPAFIAGLTWQLIAQILDVFFIVVFVSVQSVFTFIFLVPLGSRY